MLWPEVDEHLGRPSVGVTDTGSSLNASIWAPHHNDVVLEFEDSHATRVELNPAEFGFFEAEMNRDLLGVNYWVVLDQHLRRADPASRFQPQGVHGPSQAVSVGFDWGDADWRGRALHEMVIYELHVGTFSRLGRFAGVEAEIDRLVKLGVTAIELMPVAQFPGERNWGYDGVFPFAVQNSYGGPHGLRRLVDNCHRRGLAVVMDVVYNHLGPEGNYLSDFGPYFTDRYRTPWGEALNFDGHHSDGVRRFFIDNAVSWIRDYHLDGLRLDAIQMIFDNSARPFLAELAATMHRLSDELGRPIYLWGETNQNDVRQIQPTTIGGWGLDGIWNDDFHHAIHARLTGECVSVYRDHGSTENVAKALREGFVLSGQYSKHHRRRHGSCSRHVAPDRFVVFSQNHDQIGNRLYGDRLSELVSFPELKLAAACTILSANIPMLFMGEEYGERHPFLYFVDHGNPTLRQAVKRGRMRDFHSYRQAGRTVPDPGRISTYHQSRLAPCEKWTPEQRHMLRYYQALLSVRRRVIEDETMVAPNVAYDADQDVITVRHERRNGDVLIVLSFSKEPVSFDARDLCGQWQLVLDSEWPEFGGAASKLPKSWANAPEEPCAMDISPWQVAVWVQSEP